MVAEHPGLHGPPPVLEGPENAGPRPPGFGCRLAELLRGIPLVGKTAAAFFALVFVELMGLILSLGVFWYAPEVLVLLWIAEKILLFLAVLAAALMCRKLLLGGRALAAGDLAYQVDTRAWCWTSKPTERT